MTFKDIIKIVTVVYISFAIAYGGYWLYQNTYQRGFQAGAKMVVELIKSGQRNQ